MNWKRAEGGSGKSDDGVRVYHGCIGMLEIFMYTVVLVAVRGRLESVVGIFGGEYHKGKGKRRRRTHGGGTSGSSAAHKT